MLKVGEQAPDFSLPEDSNRTLNLKDYRGQHVVLFFFPRANTPG
jgi:peroxiredoxin Q/BCP